MYGSHYPRPAHVAEAHGFAKACYVALLVWTLGRGTIYIVGFLEAQRAGRERPFEISQVYSVMNALPSWAWGLGSLTLAFILSAAFAANRRQRAKKRWVAAAFHLSALFHGVTAFLMALGNVYSAGWVVSFTFMVVSFLGGFAIRE